MNKMLAAAGAILLLAGGCVSEMRTELLPGIPDPAYSKGVSAPFCGVLDGSLILGGGANFPDKPLLEGGAKKVYRDIWKYAGGTWSHAGLLPDSTAYGATFPLPGRLVLAGGNVRGESTDRVIALRMEGETLRQDSLPPLPVPLEQAGWTASGDRLYLAGGQSGPAASDRVWTCTADDFRWSELAILPRPLVQPVAYVRDGLLFVWGGFDPDRKEAFREGWCLDLRTGGWEAAPGVPDGGTFVGATGLTLPGGDLLVVGGVDIGIFNRALHNTPEDRIPYLSQEPAAYRLRRTVWRFDGKTWTSSGESPLAALAGPGTAADSGTVYVAGGERKPGVRSPEIFTLSNF